MSALSRREFLKLAGTAAAVPVSLLEARDAGVVVNDIHAQLNPTRVRAIVSPRSQKELIETIRRVRRSGGKLSICGGRHSMGGQQFGTDTTLIDLKS
jgi:FAD/FMN-containing dehydrogenase